MTDTATASAPTQGLLARAIGVVVSPRATFEGVVASPKPAGILLLVAILIGLSTALPQFTERGRQAALDLQVQATERMMGPLDDETYARMERQMQYGAYFSLFGTLVWLPIVALFFGGLYWGIFNAVLGGTASFKQVLAVVTHSMVLMALGTAAAMPVILMQGVMSMAGPFNLGALVPMLDETSFLARLLGAMSAFTVWQVVVIAIGLGVLYRRKTGPIAVALLVAYVGFAAVLISAFGAFMNFGR